MRDRMIEATGSSAAPGTSGERSQQHHALPLFACIVAARPRRSLWLSDNGK
jgi:hypothetical protein